MNTHAAEKLVRIQACDAFASTCGHLMQDSVARLQASVGCVYCQLETEEHRVGHWVIHCAWNSLDAMRASIDAIFQPALETLIASNALLSLHVCEAASARTDVPDIRVGTIGAHP